MATPDREARRLARRIVAMQEGHDALVRATQLGWSTVPVLVDGEPVEVPVPVLLEQGAQAAVDAQVALDRAALARSEADSAAAAANAAQTAAEIASAGVAAEAGTRTQAQTELDAKIGDVDARVTGVADQVAAQQLVFRVAPESVQISRPGASSVLALDNDSITMVQDGQAVAWWEGGVMHATRFEGAVVALGTHQFVREGNSTIIRAL